MAKTYRCTVEVRGYELDSFGHVNHATYFNYCEYARWKMLDEVGITLPLLNEWKRWPVIASLEAKYLKPTFMGDRLEIRTRIREHGRTSIYFDQAIYKDDEAVFEAQIRGVTINEKGKACQMPQEMNRLWGDSEGPA